MVSSIGKDRLGLDAAADHDRGPALQISADALRMALAVFLRDQGPGDVLAEQLRLGPAEHGFGGRIELDDAARFVDDDDAV